MDAVEGRSLLQPAALATTAARLPTQSRPLLPALSVVLEGTATSLMSKCICSGFATGVLNAGLLSTEAGTLGRFARNGWLAAAGKATGLESRAALATLARLLNLALAGVCAALLAHLGCVYRCLAG